MIGLFCGSKAYNNEEFKKVIKSRMNIMVLIFIIGCFTLTVSLLAEFVWDVAINDHMLGVYTGAGAGLIFVSILIWVKNRAILSDENKLKTDRLNCTDERIQEISGKAFRVATVILLISLYAAALIGGLFIPALAQINMFLVCVFLLGYIIAYKFYEKRM